MLKLSIPLIIGLLVVLTNSLSGQISSETSDFKVPTSYSKKDSIFIFNQYSSPKKGILKANIPGTGPAKFEWSAFDSITKTFSTPFLTVNNADSSEVTNLTQGGYRVHVTKPGLDTTMTAWIFLNNFTITVEKDKAGEVLFYRSTCEYIRLKAKAFPNQFKYYNPTTGAALKLENRLRFTWTANPATEDVSLDSDSAIWVSDNDIPNEDTDYTCTATDNFDLSKEDKVKYISIIPKADFETEFEEKYEEKKKSAPLTVSFTDNSKNTVKQIWTFGDGDTVIFKDQDIRNPEPHTYYVSDQAYKITLIAESDAGCIREYSDSIIIDKSELNASNFFTPGAGNEYENFIIRNVSMREFHLTIYSRSGRKVYEFHGPDINAWEGWDGKMGSSLASPGIYFYVLEAISWESPSKFYKAKDFSGFVYLIESK